MRDYKKNKLKLVCSTSGKSKGNNCKADWEKKYYLTKSRAYKEKDMYYRYVILSHKLNKIT